MNAIEIAKVFVFYLLIAAIVLFLSSMGTLLSYLLIIVISLAFIVTSGISVRPGKLLPGLVIGLVSISAVFALMLALGQVSIASISPDIGSVILFGAVLQVFVASGEELSFRGYIFAALDKYADRKSAIALSSAAFAVMHIPAMFLLGIGMVSAAIALSTIFLASVVLSLLYAYVGLLSSIGFHFSWNLMQYHVYGLGLHSEMPSIFNLSGSGNVLLTGGEFGPEASLPGLAVMLVTLGIVWYWCKHNEDNCITQKG